MDAKILKKLRLNANLTQKELAEKIGVAHNTIAMIETGKRQGDRDTINKLADYFNVSIDYLEGRETQENNSSSSLIESFIDELIDSGIITDPKNIDDETAEMILNMVKTHIQLKLKKKGGKNID